MTLLPDFFTIDCYNASDDDISSIRNAKIVHANAFDNSMICYGKVEDVYEHVSGANTIVTIALSDGQDFWNAKVGKTIGAGVNFKETFRAIVQGVKLGSYVAENPHLLRGQTLTGSLPYIVQNMASAVNARAFIRHGALHVVGKGRYSNINIISDDDLVADPGTGNEIRVVSVEVKGYAVGSMVQFENGLYRLVAQSIDADNFKGQWKTDLVLVNENKVESMGGW